MLWLDLYSHDKWQVNARCGRGGQYLFGLFRLLAHALHGGRIFPQIHTLRALEFRYQILRDTRIEIIPTEVIVSRGGKYFDEVVPDFNILF